MRALFCGDINHEKEGFFTRYCYRYRATGDNNDAGPGSARLEQDVPYAAQLMGRYMPTLALSFGLGVGHLWGGETTLDGVKQDRQQRTTNLRFTSTAYVTQKDQIQMQPGRDLAVESGAREDFRLNFRYARAF